MSHIAKKKQKSTQKSKSFSRARKMNPRSPVCETCILTNSPSGGTLTREYLQPFNHSFEDLWSDNHFATAINCHQPFNHSFEDLWSDNQLATAINLQSSTRRNLTIHCRPWFLWQHSYCYLIKMCYNKVSHSMI